MKDLGEIMADPVPSLQAKDWVLIQGCVVRIGAGDPVYAPVPATNPRAVVSMLTLFAVAVSVGVWPRLDRVW